MHLCVSHLKQNAVFADLKMCVCPLSLVSETEQLPIIAGVLSALVILLVVGIVTICAQKKKQNNKGKNQKLLFSTFPTLQFSHLDIERVVHNVFFSRGRG